jgi:hypothetical protein
MNIVTIKHTVADYDKWKIGYDADEPNRRAAGATSVTLTRAPASADGSTDIVAFIQFPDVAAAAGFLDNPGLAEAMKEAGVIGTPEVQITELVESASY